MESTITCLPCDSYLSGTKANDLNTPLPTPATNTSLSFFLLGWSHREQREEGDQLEWSHRESPWESLCFYSLSSSTFSSFSFSFCVYIVVLVMVYYWILLGGNGIGAIIFASAHCTFPPFLATHIVAQFSGMTSTIKIKNPHTIAKPPIFEHEILCQKPNHNINSQDTKSQTQIRTD